MTQVLVIKKGDQQIFKGNEDNERYSAGDIIDMPDENIPELEERGFITTYVPAQAPAAEATADTDAK